MAFYIWKVWLFFLVFSCVSNPSCVLPFPLLSENKDILLWLVQVLSMCCPTVVLFSATSLHVSSTYRLLLLSQRDWGKECTSILLFGCTKPPSPALMTYLGHESCSMECKLCVMHSKSPKRKWCWIFRTFWCPHFLRVSKTVVTFESEGFNKARCVFMLIAWDILSLM